VRRGILPGKPGIQASELRLIGVLRQPLAAPEFDTDLIDGPSASILRERLS